MADTSLIIGNGNWAVKEDSLLGYNIIQGKYVPIEMNVSRQTTATRVNNAGLIELVPRNLLTYSQQIDNTDWTKNGAPTITTNIAVAPDGTTTADGIKADDAASFKYIAQTKTVAANSTVTSSVFVKKETSETFFGGFTLIFTSPITKIFRLSVDAVLGIVQPTSGNTLTATTNVEDYGAYWRISCTATDNDSNTNVLIGYYATLSTNGTNVVQAVGSVRTVWGFQLEVGSTATDYFPTTDRFDIPRVDYSTGTASLLVEPERINRVFYSEEFDNASWSTINVTVTANATTSPSGALTADKFIPTATTGAHFIFQTGLPSNTYTFSVFAKAGGENTFSMWLVGGSKKAEFDLSNGTVISTTGASTANIIPYPNGWYRCYMYNASAGTDVRFYGRDGSSFTGNGVDGIFLWGAQAEATTVLNPTSYIPTTTATVTRTADLISKTGISSLINSPEGVLYFEGSSIANDGVGKAITLLANTSNFIKLLYSPTLNRIDFVCISAGVVSCNIVKVITDTTANNKIALKWKNNNFALWINGVNQGSDTSGNAPLSLSTLSFTNEGGGEFFAGKMKNLIVFPTALLDTELAQLTTL